MGKFTDWVMSCPQNHQLQQICEAIEEVLPEWYETPPEKEARLAEEAEKEKQKELARLDKMRKQEEENRKKAAKAAADKKKAASK